VPSDSARRGAATRGESEERRREAATGRLSFGYFLFDCMDAGGRAMQERLPRRSTNSPGANLNSHEAGPQGENQGGFS